MGNCSVKTICCKAANAASSPWLGRRDRDLVPCTEPFPEGLGPLTIKDTSLQASDVRVIGLNSDRGSTLLISRSIFTRSKSLQTLEVVLSRLGALAAPPPGSDSEPVLELRMSPSSVINFPQALFKALQLPNTDELHFAWVYPVVFNRLGRGTSAPQSPSEPGAPSPMSNNDNEVAVGNMKEIEGNAHGLVNVVTGRRPSDVPWFHSICELLEDEDIDSDDPDVSFITVGGYVYFRQPKVDFTDKGFGSGINEGCITPLMGTARPTDLDLVMARAIRFCPAGALQFSVPRRWDPHWTQMLAEQGRFQPVTALKWLALGARYMCWIRPGELFPDQRGRRRPIAHHGGFAFVFHELGDKDKCHTDRFFEVVPNPDLGRKERTPAMTANDPARISFSLPFHIAVTTQPSLEAKLLERLHALAKRSRWALVRHLLAEYPQLAPRGGEGGTTLLHLCAEQSVLDESLLRLLKDLGVEFDVEDEKGRTPEAVGSRPFRALARSVWGLSPDLFEDPLGWFRYWDRNFSGVLETSELGDALACAYRCDSLGTQWVKSYVNIYHRDGVSQPELLGPGGFLHALQGSEEFAGLRHRRLPPLFFRAQSNTLTDLQKTRLSQLEQRIEALRTEHGWESGKPAPRSAIALPLPAPSPEGSAEPEERLKSARGILGFSFEQTRALPGRAWQIGFRVDFSGSQGLDDGGLTKAWVNEIAFALWGDTELFDSTPQGCFFKPDEVESLVVDGVPVRSTEVYHWTGRFVAYTLYQRCLLDCRLCPWTFRSLQRASAPRPAMHPRSVSMDWTDTPEGEDAMLSDMASLDHTVASNLWKVRHAMTEDELKWLDFTCSGHELEADGASHPVDYQNKATYVRLFCSYMLRQRSVLGLQAFINGFFEVVPAKLLAGIPEEGILRMLLGQAEVTDAQVTELESIVIPLGLIPAKLQNHPVVREAAAWFFRAVREGDVAFRVRLLEFWMGVGRVPLGGISTIKPKPRLQIMVQSDGREGVKRIGSWPKERLPEGHTCGNELWLPLPSSYDECRNHLRLAVENFEAGFALR